MMAMTKILAIETSCDETAIAVLEVKGLGISKSFRVLSSVVSSQVALHKKFGGVVPALAKREHQRNLVPVLLKALREAGFLELESKNTEPGKKSVNNSKFIILNSILEREPELLSRIKKSVLNISVPKIDAIAVTYGPGLAPALWVGVNFAKALSLIWNKPVIPVNHLEGHIYTNLLPVNWKIQNSGFRIQNFLFPALCLIVSGGHTELVFIKKYGSYKIIGETLDDAAGEAFDKVAKMLGLGYPGGPKISKLAESFKIKNLKFKISLPRPMIKSNDYKFSFSGLKTAVLYFLQFHTEFLKSKAGKAAVACEFQKAAVDVLVSKTIRAAKEYKVKTLMIGGGVAANTLLRERLASESKNKLLHTTFYLPPTNVTGDNALMIGIAAVFGKNKKTRRELRAEPNLRLGS